MNTTEHLLVCLNEECVEIAKDADKALRFGLGDRYPGDAHGRTNTERIVDELNDLQGVIQILMARGIIPERWKNAEKQRAKVEKVVRYMEYAVEKGALVK